MKSELGHNKKQLYFTLRVGFIGDLHSAFIVNKGFGHGRHKTLCKHFNSLAI